ncbi:hypothetical protein FOMG_17525 [Fusarium oxysporum f. sp. melonis 26406]|uniref:Secreted protein n=1 Tax=Fusarium oxysporum f. sp. melonis 26406 TaxID=1089452 RepID=W9ZC81_FUSOX|nr:hypothetical protein FOMG_17525 [Fusarium oxysporum f. sp. melonis 26406]
MKLNLATVGCVLLGLATAFPGSQGEPDLDARGEVSCSSCKDRDTCGKTRGCYWEPHYECVKKDYWHDKGKECSSPGFKYDEEKCKKHDGCEWKCLDYKKGVCKKH